MHKQLSLDCRNIRKEFHTFVEKTVISLDMMGVHRQKYYDGTFVGNQVHEYTSTQHFSSKFEYIYFEVIATSNVMAMNPLRYVYSRNLCAYSSSTITCKVSKTSMIACVACCK